MTLQDIDFVIKILGGLVFIGSGMTAWYFTIKKNRALKKEEEKEKDE